jgi:SAM-dependent methyltransferase
MTEPPYPDVYFARQDASDDGMFYAAPRKVVHIDDTAIATLRDTVFANTLPLGGSLLDLMSGWRSHLPANIAYSRVVGLGMNAEEMADNPQLTEYVVHDLNRAPALPFPDASFDAAVCSVSVQYLVRPLDVFADVRRVLKPGGTFVVSFSNRCFPSKAIWVWLYTDDDKHVSLVSDYFRRTGFAKISSKSYLQCGGDPLYVVTGYRPRR